ncbi:MAG TPA: YdeI/OmpD-associated family protein [Cyclobacteriaceae bacterium]|nr:YdeI/OmpD-associated family protein [Cyclobacteriaceae bacterium]
MTPGKKRLKIDKYFGTWEDEAEALRTIILDCGLDEELKWGKPCYTFEGKNIVLIQGFKGYCALLFLKGFMLSDPNGILVKTGKNTTVGRQIRFGNVKEIVKMKSILKTYVYQAVEVEKSGLKPDIKRRKEPVPEELQDKFDKHPAFKNAFYGLTPGRQRAYIYYFKSAKQSKTRESRIEKYAPQILKGEGLNDDYTSTRKKVQS